MSTMTMQDRGMTRAQLKTGSGKGADVADEHVHEMLGSRDLWVYVTPKSKPKGYEDLKTYLLEQGCAVDVSNTAPMLPAKGYKAIKVTRSGEILTDDVIRRAHRWAHQRNYLHSFFKPYKNT
jgi:hypothetical protein